MKSVIVVTSVHPPFDKRVWRHCRGLAKAGVEVHLVCPWDVKKGAEQDGVTLHPFSAAHGMWERLFKLPRRIRAEIDLLLDDASILHIHDPDLLILAARYRKRIPVVYDCHEFFVEQARQRTYIPTYLRPVTAFGVDKVEKYLVKRIGNAAVAANGLVERFSACGVATILVGNEASEDVLKTVAADWAGRNPSIVFIGAQHQENGSLLFLKVASLLKEKYPQLRFIVSDRFRNDDFKKRYLETADQLGVTEQLLLHPNVMAHEIMRVLNLGTVAVNPNLRTEAQATGNHTKMYEFMAAGLPTVCSDLPPQVELVKKCASGLVARPENPESFVEAIGKLLDDGELRLRMGENAQKAFSEQYCYERRMPDLIRFYQDAVSRHECS